MKRVDSSSHVPLLCCHDFSFLTPASSFWLYILENRCAYSFSGVWAVHPSEPFRPIKLPLRISITAYCSYELYFLVSHWGFAGISSWRPSSVHSGNLWRRASKLPIPPRNLAATNQKRAACTLKTRSRNTRNSMSLTWKIRFRYLHSFVAAGPPYWTLYTRTPKNTLCTTRETHCGNLRKDSAGTPGKPSQVVQTVLEVLKGLIYCQKMACGLHKQAAIFNTGLKGGQNGLWAIIKRPKRGKLVEDARNWLEGSKKSAFLCFFQLPKVPRYSFLVVEGTGG